MDIVVATLGGVVLGILLVLLVLNWQAIEEWGRRNREEESCLWCECKDFEVDGIPFNHCPIHIPFEQIKQASERELVSSTKICPTHNISVNACHFMHPLGRYTADKVVSGGDRMICFTHNIPVNKCRRLHR